MLFRMPRLHLYIACEHNYNKVVQVLLDHGVQMNIPNKVSDISCIHVKLFNTQKVMKLLW